MAIKGEDARFKRSSTLPDDPELRQLIEDEAAEAGLTTEDFLKKLEESPWHYMSDEPFYRWHPDEGQ